MMQTVLTFVKVPSQLSFWLWNQLQFFNLRLKSHPNLHNYNETTLRWAFISGKLFQNFVLYFFLKSPRQFFGSTFYINWNWKYKLVCEGHEWKTKKQNVKHAVIYGSQKAITGQLPRRTKKINLNWTIWTKKKLSRITANLIVTY